MAVGLPGFDLKRMTIRANINPLDVSTIVSIYPKKITEVKPTIQPGVFIIPPGTYDKPSLVHIGPSSWWKETDDGQPLLEIPHSSVTVAHSVVRDWLVGILGCDMDSMMPGLFYVPGKVTLDDFKKNADYKALFEQANARQRAWFAELVKIADSLWARTNGNPLSISDDMKLAARELSLPDKPWIKDFQNIQMVNCKACGSLKNPQYPVCPNCKAIDDPKRATELGIKFAS
jgi:hypothetical protein